MNTLVAFALLCCMLPTANGLFGKLLTMTTEPDDFCDEGPPGRYCLVDLSGWHDCHVDPKTGKMVDTIYNCPSNTRCVLSLEGWGGGIFSSTGFNYENV